MNPRVSVIIATYNRAHLLKVAIDSVLSQTYADYEIIIADDGSCDDTAAVVGSYLQSGVPVGRIRYFYQHNQGKSVALNNALLQAKGEWIAFLDSDDYWLPYKLELQFCAIEKFQNQCGACFTDGQFVNNPHMDTTAFKFFGRHYDEPVGILHDTAKILAEAPAGVSIVTLLCRADLIQRTGGFDPDLRFTEDYDFLFRLALLTDYCFVNKPLVIIDRAPAANRHSGESAIWDRIDFRLQCEQRRYEKWMTLTTEYPAQIRRILTSHLRRVHSGWANWYLSSGDYGIAQEEILRAARYELTARLLAKLILTRVFPRAARKAAVKRGFDPAVF